MAVLPIVGRGGAFRRDLLDWGCPLEWIEQYRQGDDAPWKLDIRRVPILSFMGRLETSDHGEFGEKLFSTVFANDAAGLKKLLRQTQDRDRQLVVQKAYDGDGFFLIHHASALGHEDVAKVLIDAGCNVDTVNAGGDAWLNAYFPQNTLLPLNPSTVGLVYCITPLHLAARHGNIRLLRLLTSYGGADKLDKHLLLIRAEVGRDAYGTTARRASLVSLEGQMPAAVTATQLAALEGQWEAAVWLMEYEHGEDWVSVCCADPHSALCLGGIPFIQWLLDCGKTPGDLGVRFQRHALSACLPHLWASGWLPSANITHLEHILNLMANLQQLTSARLSSILNELSPLIFSIAGGHNSCVAGCSCYTVLNVFHKFGVYPRHKVCPLLHQVAILGNRGVLEFLLRAGWKADAWKSGQADGHYTPVDAVAGDLARSQEAALLEAAADECVSLLKLCRMVICRQLCDPRKVQNLPISRQMKSYLLFESSA